MNDQPDEVSPIHLLAAFAPEVLESLSDVEATVLANTPEIWRPGLTPSELAARDDLVRAMADIDAHNPSAAAVAIDRAREALAMQSACMRGGA